MTESPKSSRDTRRPTARRRKPSAVPVFASLGLLIAGSFAYLTLGVVNGSDPALGKNAIAAVTPERPVIVRKVIKRRVVTTVIPSAPVATGYTSGGSYSGGTSYSAPATSYSAPAPAPAPVVTASS